jgi:hypothetical protein
MKKIASANQAFKVAPACGRLFSIALFPFALATSTSASIRMNETAELYWLRTPPYSMRFAP